MVSPPATCHSPRVQRAEGGRRGKPKPPNHSHSVDTPTCALNILKPGDMWVGPTAAGSPLACWLVGFPSGPVSVVTPRVPGECLLTLCLSLSRCCSSSPACERTALCKRCSSGFCRCRAVLCPIIPRFCPKSMGSVASGPVWGCIAQETAEVSLGMLPFACRWPAVGCPEAVGSVLDGVGVSLLCLRL